MGDKFNISDEMILRAKRGEMPEGEYRCLALLFMKIIHENDHVTHRYLTDVRALEIAKVVAFALLLFLLIGRWRGWL